AQQVTTAMLQQLGAPIEEARSISIRAEELIRQEAKRKLDEERAAIKKAVREADRKAAAKPKSIPNPKPSKTREEREAEHRAGTEARATFVSRYSYKQPNYFGTWDMQAGPVWSYYGEQPDVYSADRIANGWSEKQGTPTVK